MNLRFDPEAFRMPIRQASYDDAKKQVLVDSALPVYNFDDIKEYVCRKLRDNSFTRSCDAYYVDDSGREYLIEFKNQKQDDVPRRAVKEKAYDSLYLLLLTFDREKSLAEVVGNVSYMVVYNDRAPDGPKGTRHGHSESFEKLAAKFGELAKAESPRTVKFGLGYLKGRLYREVYTLDTRDFMRQFVKHWSNGGS